MEERSTLWVGPMQCEEAGRPETLRCDKVVIVTCDKVVTDQSINQYVFQDFTRILLTGYMVNHSKQSKDRHRLACVHASPPVVLVHIAGKYSIISKYNIQPGRNHL